MRWTDRRPAKVQARQGMPEPVRDRMEFGYGPSLGLISPSPPHGQDTRGCQHFHLNEKGTNEGDESPSHPSRRSFGTARRIWNITRSHLGSTLGSGKSCPDPGRLSTFGVSGLYPCRRLTYRGACLFMVAPQPGARQTHCRIPYTTSASVIWLTFVDSTPGQPLTFAAYPRPYADNVAGNSGLFRARSHVHRIEKPDVAAARAGQRFQSADDHGRAHRGD